jgi:hypothetical protein
MAADWVHAEDQVWLGQWARQWATDPKNGFCNPAKPNEMDRQLLSLFDAIEACAGDIDERLEKLHKTWKRAGFLTTAWYAVKLHYLFQGVGYEVAMRSGRLKTDSAEQTLLNWNRVQNIYSGQDGTYRTAKAWIGPMTQAGVESVGVDESANDGRYKGYIMSGGTRMEGPLLDAVMEVRDMYRAYKARRLAKLGAVAIASGAEDRLDMSWDDGVITDA